MIHDEQNNIIHKNNIHKTNTIINNHNLLTIKSINIQKINLNPTHNQHFYIQTTQTFNKQKFK